MRLLLPLLLLSALVGCTQPKGPEVVKAWIPAGPINTKVLAGYLTISNPGKHGWLLEQIQSAAFEEVELHDVSQDKGMAQMREVQQLKIPAGSTVELKPGGRHLMLKRPLRPLQQGNLVDLQLMLRDDSGRQLTLDIQAEVTAPPGGE